MRYRTGAAAVLLIAAVLVVVLVVTERGDLAAERSTLAADQALGPRVEVTTVAAGPTNRVIRLFADGRIEIILLAQMS